MDVCARQVADYIIAQQKVATRVLVGLGLKEWTFDSVRGALAALQAVYVEEPAR